MKSQSHTTFGNKATRHLISTIAFVSLAVVSFALPAVAETVKSLDSSLFLDNDGSIIATEAIVIDFGSTLKTEPIYRTFCTKAHTMHKRKEDAFVHIIEVTNDSGCSLQHEARSANQQIAVTIKDTRDLIYGVNTYKFDYAIKNAVVVSNGKPELNWNATGIWKVPLNKATIKLYLPKGTTPRSVSAFIDSATGRGVDHTRKRCETSSHDNEVKFTVMSLQPGESLHIAVGLPDSVAPPPPKVVAAEQFWQHWNALAVVPITVGVMLLFYWLMFGRDQRIRPEDELPDDWRPPVSLTPAEAGTLIDERCDKPDVVATLIDLAVRGYLRVEKKGYGGLTMRGAHDYRFTRLSPPVLESLKPHEELFIRNLFGFINDQDLLSNMRGHFHEHIDNLNSAVWKTLHRSGYFVRHPEQDRRHFLWMSCFLFIIGGGALLVTTGEARLAGAGSIIASLIVALSSNAMPARTSKGSAALKQLKSFKQFIHKASKVEIEGQYRDDPTIFSRYLPYAIVLKEGQRWADLFEGVVKEQPDWFWTEHSGAFSSHQMMEDLKQALSAMQNIFLDSPASGTSPIDFNNSSLR